MRKVKLIPIALTAAVLLCARDARPSAVLLYTGDPNGKTGYGNYQDLSGAVNIPESQVFENFVVAPGSTWKVSSLFVNETDLGPSNVTEASWSIRTGMAAGNGGAVLYSGAGAATEAAGNISKITVSGLNITLGPGEYWMNITPQTNGTKLVADTTSGLDSVNATLTQSGLWYESRYQNYTPVTADFSMGIDGTKVTATPEPAGWLMMGAGFAGLGVLWRMRRVSERKRLCRAQAAIALLDPIGTREDSGPGFNQSR